MPVDRLTLLPMLPPNNSGICIGPLFSEIARNARWRDDPYEQYFPASQRVADEHEAYLEFAKRAGRWEQLSKRLQTDDRARRDETFSEIAVAKMFDRDGFPIVKWEPTGADEKIGEYEIDGGEASIFVEVKSPGWESEYGPEQRAARIQQPKYVNGEARCIDQVTPIRRTLTQKAIPKLTGTTPSLVVIADDLWFGLQEDPLSCDIALFSHRIPGDTGYGAENGLFTTPAYAQLGAVMFFWVSRYVDRPLEPGVRLYRNPFAAERARLPERFASYYHAIDNPTYRLQESDG